MGQTTSVHLQLEKAVELNFKLEKIANMYLSKKNALFPAISVDKSNWDHPKPPRTLQSGPQKSPDDSYI